jgi:hypothetical protein
MEHTFIVMESSYYGFLGHGHGHGHVYGPRIQGQALVAQTALLEPDEARTTTNPFDDDDAES